VVFVHTTGAANPTFEFTADGLRISVERPLGATGNLGHWAAAATQNVALPGSFLLVATFERPSRMELGTAAPSGTFAPSLLLSVGTAGTLMGVTSQFRQEGVRMNLPGTGLTPNLPLIPQSLVDRILDPQHPTPLTLALTLNRSATAGAGTGRLFVGNDEASSLTFNLASLALGVPIVDIRAGMGTASGSEYRATVFLLRFQIWAQKN
jgi:hypothetical protein